MHRFKITFVCFMLMLTSACAMIYKQDVQQGNVVDDEMLNKIQPGMNKIQIRYHLGSPLLEDPFNQNRWDYYYTFNKGGHTKREQMIITLIFDDYEQLSDITGSTQSETKMVNVVKLPEEGKLNPVKINEPEKPSFWSRMKTKILRQ